MSPNKKVSLRLQSTLSLKSRCNCVCSLFQNLKVSSRHKKNHNWLNSRLFVSRAHRFSHIYCAVSFRCTRPSAYRLIFVFIAGSEASSTAYNDASKSKHTHNGREDGLFLVVWLAGWSRVYHAIDQDPKQSKQQKNGTTSHQDPHLESPFHAGGCFAFKVPKSNT